MAGEPSEDEGKEEGENAVVETPNIICPDCGHTTPLSKLRMLEAGWTCPHCGTSHRLDG